MATRKRGRPIGGGLSHSAIKERKRQSDRERNKEKIFIGTHFERWNRVKGELNFTFNYELAGFLLDRYEHGDKRVSSTPMRGHPRLVQMTESISEISSAESGKHTELVMSGVEDIDAGPSSSKKAKGAKFSTSFLDPFELSIEISTEDSGDSEASDDETYHPSFNISIGPVNVAGIQDCPGAEAVFPQEEEEAEEEEQEQEEETGPSLLRIQSPNDIPLVLENKTALVYMDQLLALAHKSVQSTCKVKGCGENVQCTTKNVGSAVYLKWICSNSHIADKWCSQPVLNRGLHAGDLMIASSILFSGNNYSKIELFSKFLKMGFPSVSTFTRLIFIKDLAKIVNMNRLKYISKPQ